MFRSNDNGANWYPINTGLTNLNIRALAVNGTTVIVGTYGGGLFRSNDNGDRWQHIDNGINNNYIYSLAYSGNSIYAGSYAGIYRSTDSGLNWYLSDSALSTYKTALTLVTDGDMIFAGTANGAYFSSDLGKTWKEINRPINRNDGFYANTLVIHKSRLFAGEAREGGVFRATLPLLPIPNTATIEALTIAPNPATDKITLQLDLAAATPVEIFLFNTLGQLVRQQALGSFAAGSYDVEQEMNGIPTGSYTLVIQAGGERTARRVQLIR
jgi:hypothetical protein